MNINELILGYESWIILGLSVFSILILIIVIVLCVKLNKLKDKYDYFMGGKKDKPIEALLTEYIDKVIQVEKDNEKIIEQCNIIKKDIKRCIKKVGIVRYNAFADMGGDLCYVIALLDEYDDGVIINGIHSRDGSYTYAKPMEKGKCSYTLSAEEQQALQIAQMKK